MLFVLTLFVCALTVTAFAVVTPSVCYEPRPESTTRTLAARMAPGTSFVEFTGTDIQGGIYKVVINPGGATEESSFAYHLSSANTLSNGQNGFGGGFAHEHIAGETVVISWDGQAAFGYNNTGSSTVTIPRGVSTSNYFSPGPLVYSFQPTFFPPGRHEGFFSVPVSIGKDLNWTLSGVTATFSGTADNMCGTINYQGRLTDGASAGNGQYDMRFQAYDTETGGTAQGAAVNVDNVQVTNGVFTVQLKLGSSLTKNFAAKFLEIGVKPGNAAAGDPYTILTPRQPITAVPYAINAQYSTSANNATQLGGLPPASYMLTAAALGQRVDTVIATGNLQVSTETQTYTQIPGLTKTLNIPEKSSLFISTDGGMQSTGAGGSFSVVDIAIFIDGVEESSRRVVVNNFLVPLSVDNWALSIGKTLPAGSHTFSVRAKGGTSGVPANLTSGGLLGGQLTITVVRW
jgi:hypothetical protein